MELTYKGYAGKILRINLSKGKITEQEIDNEFARLFLGGNGFGIKILADELDPDVDPYSPENKLIFMTGPLNGTRAPATPKYIVQGKSPLTGFYADSVSSGEISAELKFAGYDGIVVEGKASRPSYIYIDNGDVEIRDAGDIWGRDTFETQEMIKEEVGDADVQVAAIGPGGENLVRYASVIQGYRAAGRCGFGAVMGSKNLKAIAVRGDGSIEVAMPEEFYEWVDTMVAEFKKNPGTGKVLFEMGTPAIVNVANGLGVFGTRNWKEEEFEGAEDISGERLAKEKLYSRGSCFSCPIGCVKVFKGVYNGKAVLSEGPEYETLYSLGSCIGNNNLDSIILMDRLCDELGIDTVSAGVSIAFAMECFERGILKDGEVDSLKLQFGNEEAAIECLRKIAYRDGIGDLLAEGTARMARKIGKGTEKFAINVKGLEIPGHSPRGLQGMMLGYATSTRGGSHHDSRPTTEYGVVDRTTTDGKAHLTMSIQHMTAVGDSLVLCRFTERVYGFTLEWNMEHDAQPEVLRTAYVDMVNLVTGMDLSLKELVKVGERIYNLERYVNTRMGMRRSHDTLPRRIMEEPIPDGPSKGMVASKEKLNRLLDEYYSLRGWNENGIPTPGKLKELGLIKEAEVVKTLE